MIPLPLGAVTVLLMAFVGVALVTIAAGQSGLELWIGIEIRVVGAHGIVAPALIVRPAVSLEPPPRELPPREIPDRAETSFLLQAPESRRRRRQAILASPLVAERLRARGVA